MNFIVSVGRIYVYLPSSGLIFKEAQDGACRMTKDAVPELMEGQI